VQNSKGKKDLGDGGGDGHSEDGEWLSFENETTLMREEKRRDVDGPRGTKKIPEDMPRENTFDM
jgi:hypothetical protein